MNPGPDGCTGCGVGGGDGGVVAKQGLVNVCPLLVNPTSFKLPNTHSVRSPFEHEV